MREILFRGKTEPSKRWVVGDLLQWSDGEMCICENRNHFEKDKYRVIPETLGQYTGLTDINGKKFFEGDIQGNWIDQHIEMGYVEMKHGAFGLHRKQGYYRPFKDWLEDYEYEIIGNIHDNPDLLKGE